MGIKALRHITTSRAASQTVRLVQEELAIAGGSLRILIEGDDDRLDVLIAPTFSRSETGTSSSALRKDEGSSHPRTIAEAGSPSWFQYFSLEDFLTNVRQTSVKNSVAL